MPDSFSAALAPFEPLSLAETESVALLDRTDTKYLVAADRLPEILAGLERRYAALEVAGLRVSPYETLYYDTSRFDCYRRHHAGRAVRAKVRARRYAATGGCFLEVKRRDNHDRTLKRRVAIAAVTDRLDDAHAPFVRDHSGLDPGSLRGVLWVGYRRATLVSLAEGERVTIDVGLAFRGVDPGRFAGLAIAEVKRPRAAGPSAIVGALHRHRVLEAGVSKYCLGLATARPELPRNNFLDTLRHIDRVLHAAG